MRDVAMPHEAGPASLLRWPDLTYDTCQNCGQAIFRPFLEKGWKHADTFMEFCHPTDEDY